MNQEKVTFLLIPESESEVRRYSISKQKMKVLLLVSSGFLCLLTMSGLHYARSVSLKKSQNSIILENKKLREEVRSQEVKLNHMNQFIQWAQRFSKRVKIISNIQTQNTTNDRPVLPGQTELEDKIQITLSGLLNVEKEFYSLQESLANKKTFLLALPTRKPADGYFTSGFGVRSHPHGGNDKMHEGVDVANAYGTKIRATANGVVKFAGRKGGYGRIVIIDHGYGLETWYAHCWKVLVKSSQKVKRGQKIALMGSSGRSTGSHVHYEVRVNRIPVDPLTYILEE